MQAERGSSAGRQRGVSPPHAAAAREDDAQNEPTSEQCAPEAVKKSRRAARYPDDQPRNADDAREKVEHISAFQIRQRVQEKAERDDYLRLKEEQS